MTIAYLKNTILIICFLCFIKFVSVIKKNVEQNSILLKGDKMFPFVINTWPFTDAAQAAWDILRKDGSALDAVEKGCTKCEELQCDYTVGFGGSPDENGETTLDAMIIDGETHDIGAVGALRNIKGAISVARKVMENTKHTLLVGSKATEFAAQLGFKKEDLSTDYSKQKYNEWKENDCQPNFWKNVQPNPTTSCGPYSLKDEVEMSIKESKSNQYNHDTIGMIAIDSNKRIAAGTSTNGASHKIPGRVGDSPIPGSGAYVNKNVGAAAATGDGDVMMRFLPSLVTVDYMRSGMSPREAADKALQRIASFYPNFSGAIIAVTAKGEYDASCYNTWDNSFKFTIGKGNSPKVKVIEVPCINSS